MIKSRSVLSRLLPLCRGRPPRPLQEPAVFRYHHHQGHLNKVRARIKPMCTPSLNRWHSRTTTSSSTCVPSPWFHDPRKVATTIAFATGGAMFAVHLRYHETVPFTGRTHLVVFSLKEARECDEAEFAVFKKEDASKVLGPDDPNTIRVRRIAHRIITAAHVAFAIKHQANTRTTRHHDGLKWMDGLDWEVIVVQDDKEYIECFAGAGKIVVYTRLLEVFKTDAEIAACIGHEVIDFVSKQEANKQCSSSGNCGVTIPMPTEADEVPQIQPTAYQVMPRRIHGYFSRRTVMFLFATCLWIINRLVIWLYVFMVLSAIIILASCFIVVPKEKVDIQDARSNSFAVLTWGTASFFEYDVSVAINVRNPVEALSVTPITVEALSLINNPVEAMSVTYTKPLEGQVPPHVLGASAVDEYMKQNTTGVFNMMVRISWEITLGLGDMHNMSLRWPLSLLLEPMVVEVLKMNSEGKTRKVEGCSCVVIRGNEVFYLSIETL